MMIENGFEQIVKASFIHPVITHLFIECSTCEEISGWKLLWEISWFLKIRLTTTYAKCSVILSVFYVLLLKSRPMYTSHFESIVEYSQSITHILFYN